MLRSVVAIALLPMLLTTPAPLTSPASAGPDGDCPTASVDATFLCVALYFSVDGSNKHEWVTIDWGDGSSGGVDCPRILGECDGTVPHTYTAPGTYTIEVTALSGYCASSTQTLDVHVADAPDLDIRAVSQGEYWVQPGTLEPLNTAAIRRSTVDWGDGSPVEEFEWTACDEGVLCLPRHDYAANGTYTIVTRVEYSGAWESTCYERAAGFDVEIGNLTGARRTTWGTVKSRYR